MVVVEVATNKAVDKEVDISKVEGTTSDLEGLGHREVGEDTDPLPRVDQAVVVEEEDITEEVVMMVVVGAVVSEEDEEEEEEEEGVVMEDSVIVVAAGVDSISTVVMEVAVVVEEAAAAVVDSAATPTMDTTKEVERWKYNMIPYSSVACYQTVSMKTRSRNTSDRSVSSSLIRGRTRIGSGSIRTSKHMSLQERLQ